MIRRSNSCNSSFETKMNSKSDNSFYPVFNKGIIGNSEPERISFNSLIDSCRCSCCSGSNSCDSSSDSSSDCSCCSNSSDSSCSCCSGSNSGSSSDSSNNCSYDSYKLSSSNSSSNNNNTNNNNQSSNSNTNLSDNIIRINSNSNSSSKVKYSDSCKPNRGLQVLTLIFAYIPIIILVVIFLAFNVDLMWFIIITVIMVGILAGLVGLYMLCINGWVS